MALMINKLSHRVILAALLCLLPSFFISFNNVLNTYNNQIENLKHETDFFAEQMMLVQGQRVNRAEQYLKLLAKSPEIQVGNTLTCQKFLSRQLKLTDLFSNIGSPLVTGELKCNALPLSKKVNVKDRPYIQKALQESGFSISRLIQDRVTNNLSVNLALPVYNDLTGETKRLLVGVLPFQWWQDLIAGNNYEGLLAFITDKDYKVIANYGDNAPAIGEHFLEGKTFSGSDYVLVKKHYVRGNANKDLALAFWVALPTKEAYETAKTEFIESFFIILIGLILSAILLFLAAKFLFIQPVKTLLDEFDHQEPVINRSFLTMEGLDENIKKIASQQAQAKQNLSHREQELIQIYHKQNSILKSVSIGIVELDDELKILSFSQRCQSFYRVLEKEVKLQLLISLEANESSQQSNDIQSICDAVEGNESNFIEVISRTDRHATQYSDAQTLYFKWAFSQVDFDNSNTKWVVVVEDVTVHKLRQDSLAEKASKDWLTKLPNRYAIIKMIDDSIKHNPENGFSLVLFDLNGFKLINDSFGHDVGDALIIALSQRMQDLLLDDEHIARLGGDEFLLYLPRKNPLGRISFLKNYFFQPIEVMNRSFSCSASAGVAVYPKDGHDALGLIRCSDLAMYEAKQNKSNDSVFYDERLEQKGIERFEMESAIKYGLAHDEFSLHYQPVVNPTRHKVLCVEALIRWQSIHIGQVSPAVFIPIAEESGYINQVGDWVLEQVLADLSQIRSIFGPDVKVNINLSPYQLKNMTLISKLIALAKQDAIVHTLVLEITEGTLVDEDAVKCLWRLQEIGYCIALDDFGTGFASLSHISKMPIQVLKIDQSFIAQCRRSHRDLMLLKNIIAMAKDLELKIIAEGVEQEEQATQLIQFGCYHMQGYLYSRPLPLRDFNGVFSMCIEES